MAKRHIDEILGNDFPEPRQDKPTGPQPGRMAWNPEAPDTVPIKKTGTDRFSFAAEKPDLVYASQQDLDALIARIRAEEQQPPHKINQARIAALKREAMELMGQMESAWIQQRADALLPLCEG